MELLRLNTVSLKKFSLCFKYLKKLFYIYTTKGTENNEICLHYLLSFNMSTIEIRVHA